ncbi:MAG TPA: DNA polymerase IV [Thermoplasmata archaeon]|nr:DNA polymerase IV [Thermoplasmata archaeon]
MRWTIYIDLDAYYVSCERRERPDLAGRPVIVGADPRRGPTRGVVLSASYEARASGVRSAMPVGIAARLCPEATWVAPDFEKYERVAQEVREFLGKRFERIAPLSIDEAAISVELPGASEAEAVARNLQREIESEMRLPCSIGVAVSRTIAKIATDKAKPGGVVVVAPERTVDFLAPLSVRAIPGVGPKTAEHLQSVGISTIGELRSLPPSARRHLGRFADELHRIALGEPDPASEESGSGPRSRSTDHTFDRDASEAPEVLEAIDRLSDELAKTLERDQLRYRTVTIGLRWEDFQRVQRSRTLPGLQEGPEALRRNARRLFGELWESEARGAGRKLRTVSVAVEKLSEASDRQVRLDQYEPGRSSTVK